MGRWKVPDFPVIKRFFPDASEHSGNSRKLPSVARVFRKQRQMSKSYMRGCWRVPGILVIIEFFPDASEHSENGCFC